MLVPKRLAAGRTYMRFLLSIWVWSVTGILAIPECLLMLLIRMVHRDPVRRSAGRFMHRCGRLITRLNPRWRVEIEGDTPSLHDTAFVIVSNHQSHSDIPVLCRLPLDFKWVAKRELFRVPVAGWMFHLSGQIPVDRKDARAGAKALMQTAKYLGRGMPVMFFPEGTRSGGKRLLRFQDGPFRIALKKGVPVLPVVVTGTGKLLPPNSLLFSSFSRFRVRMLEPVLTGDGAFTDAAVLRDAVRARMQEALDEMEGDAEPEDCGAPVKPAVAM